MPTSSPVSPGRRRAWLQLLTCAAVLWLFFGIVSPRLVALVPAWQRYGEVQEEMGLNSGALYYTDVPVSLECERANRAAVAAALARRQGGGG